MQPIPQQHQNIKGRQETVALPPCVEPLTLARPSLTDMASSRIFIKGLPPTITEAEARKHFSAGNREITDIKLIPQRRIGYVGYKTPEDASGAVKYFNRSYVRMSKISVEPAKAVSPFLFLLHPVVPAGSSAVRSAFANVLEC